MHDQYDARPLRIIVETRNGIPNDIVTDGTHYYPISHTWKDDAWFHASMWDTGVCYQHSHLTDFADELRRLHHTNVANALYSYCHWTLVQVYLTVTNPSPINAAFLHTLTEEIKHYEIIWETWKDNNPTLWESLGSHPKLNQMS